MIVRASFFDFSLTLSPLSLSFLSTSVFLFQSVCFSPRVKNSHLRGAQDDINENIQSRLENETCTFN